MLSEDQIRQFREDGYVIARGALPWTTGTSSSPSQAGTLLRRPMAGFYSAVDKKFGISDLRLYRLIYDIGISR